MEPEGGRRGHDVETRLSDDATSADLRAVAVALGSHRAAILDAWLREEFLATTDDPGGPAD